MKKLILTQPNELVHTSFITVLRFAIIIALLILPKHLLSQQCTSYNWGGYDSGTVEYVDCFGDTQTINYCGSCISAFQQVSFCARSIIGTIGIGDLEIINVNDAGVLSGNQQLCIGSSNTFSSTVNGGTWTSSDPLIATINSTNGLITGVSAGISIIKYSVSSTDGCADAFITRNITVEVPIAPVFVEILPSDTSVNCNSIPAASILTANNNCGPATVTVTDSLLDLSDHVFVGLSNMPSAVSYVANNPSNNDEIIFLTGNLQTLMETFTFNCFSPSGGGTATINLHLVNSDSTFGSLVSQIGIVNYTTVPADYVLSPVTDILLLPNQLYGISIVANDLLLLAIPNNSTTEIDVMDSDLNWQFVSTNFGALYNGQSVPMLFTIKTNYDFDPLLACIEKKIMRVYSAVSGSGNEINYTQFISIIDTIPPVFIEALPTDTTVNCDGVPAAPTLTATDNCLALPIVTYSENRTAGSCPNSYTLTRTWTTEDGCNSTVHSQIINVQDTLKPRFVTPLPADTTLNCNSLTASIIMQAADNCGSDALNVYEWNSGNWDHGHSNAGHIVNNTHINFQFIDTLNSLLPTFPNSYDMTYRGDIAGPILKSAIFEFNLVSLDTIIAEVNVELGVNGIGVNDLSFKLFDVDGETSPIRQEKYEIIGFLAGVPVYPSLTAMGSQLVTGNSVLGIDPVSLAGADSPNGVVRINFSTPVDNVKIRFSMDPSSIIAPGDQAGFSIYNLYFRSPQGNYPVSVAFTETRLDGNCSNNYTLSRKWTATDLCGNNIDHTQIITIQDTTAPIFTVLGPQEIVYTNSEVNWCSTVPKFEEVDYTRARLDNNPTIYYTTWSFQENIQNISTESFANIKVAYLHHYWSTSPYVAPTPCWSSNPTAPGSGGYPGKFDEVNGHWNHTTALISGAEPSTPKPISIMRQAGTNLLSSTEINQWQAEQLLNIPILSPYLSDNLFINNSILDSSDFIPLVSIQGVIDPGNAFPLGFEFTMERQYTTNGWFPGYGSEFYIYGQRILNTLLPSDTTINCGTPLPIAPDLAAQDNCTQAITVNFIQDTILVLCENSYTIRRTWYAVDSCGNSATHIQRITIQDTIAPAFVEVLPTDTLMNCDALIIPAILTATDNCSLLPVITLSIDTLINANNNQLVLTWNASDGCNNSNVHFQIITLQDTVKPIFPNGCGNDTTLYLGTSSCDITLPDFTFLIENSVTDNCGDFTSGTLTLTQNPPAGETLSVGNHTIWMIATDNYANTDSCSFELTIKDTIAPLFVNCIQPTSIFSDAISCSIILPDYTASAQLDVTDNCGNILMNTITLSQSPLSGTSLGLGAHTIWIIAMDNSGNSDSCAFILTVLDTIAPVISGCPNDTVVLNTTGECGALVSWTLIPSALDNCNLPIITSSHQNGSFFPVGSTIVTYYAADSSGNSDSCSFTIIVNDLELPQISITVPSLLCAGEIVNWQESITDNCGIASITSSHSNGTIFPLGTTTILYTVVDIHGNTANYSFDVIVVPSPTVTIDSISTSNTVLCIGKDLNVSIINPNSGYTYTWFHNGQLIGSNPSFTISSIQPNDAGIYTVLAENSYGCISKADTITLSTENCSIIIYESFSPNGDGKNEYFFIENLEGYPDTKVWIYDRWGLLVFEDKNYLNNWNGRSQSNLNVGGDELPEGTYYYLVELGGNVKQNNSGKLYKGYVYLKK